MSNNSKELTLALKGIEPLLKTKGFWLFQPVEQYNRSGTLVEVRDVYVHDSGQVITTYELGPNAGKVKIDLVPGAEWVPPSQVLADPANLEIFLQVAAEIIASDKAKYKAQQAQQVHPAQQRK